MKIHGIRIYPQSVEVVRGVGAPIFVHGSVSDDYSDFFYAFRPLAALWRGHVFANDFAVGYDERGRREDPMPGLREQFGSSLLGADIDSQLLLLRGDDFEHWGKSMYFCEGAFLPIFRETPSFELLKRLYWGRDFRLTSDTWPSQMRGVLHMWDDIYWQLFTTERSDLDALMRAHTGDPKLEMYFVDLDREFPNPSNQQLQLATLADERIEG
jgi:hypothetical protein